MADVYTNKVLLIDDACLLETHNLKRKVNQAIKHPEPILKLAAPWEDCESYCLLYMNVLYDEEQKLFKMWYMVGNIAAAMTGAWNSSERGRSHQNILGPPLAYAISKDGIHWEKPVMNLVEFRGSRKNNYILPSFDLSVIRDPSDPPSRRYKMVFADGGNSWARFHMPLCLAYSGDGIHWDVPSHVNPIHRGVSDGAWEFFYDENRRKYQIYSRRAPNLPRDISLYESSDLVNWEDKGCVLIPGDEHDPADMFNFHGMVPFRYEDFYLGMLNTMYTLPGAETYEYYNVPPAGYGMSRLGLVDIQLSYSRDAVKWSRPDDRSAVIPNGKPGSPDEGIIFAHAGRPIVLNGETWIYYTGRRDRHNFHSRELMMETVGGDARKMCVGMLARMPEDHWVSLDAGREEGWLIAKPASGPSRLLVNADANGGSIEAELLTPNGQAIKGFTRAECIGISNNGKDQEIKWKTIIHPHTLNEKHRGGLCLKFYVKNAKLYSYSLMNHSEPN
jgi:hypothetical protein